MRKVNFMNDRDKLHKNFERCLPEAADNFNDIMEITFKDAALSAKVKELIALGISVSVRCEPCMRYHVEKALGRGATREEVLEAMQVGYEMAAGAVVPPLRKVLYDMFSEE